VHRTTLLRLVAALAEPRIGAAPEVTGVDDFALRKGPGLWHRRGRRGHGQGG
jgi:hypothetical protein